MGKQLNKKCSKCGVYKHLNKFAKRKEGKDGYRGTCKSCRYEDRKKWLDNGGLIVCEDIARKYRTTHKFRTARLKRLYGLSQEDWAEKFEKQKGCCDICGIHQSALKTTLHVDHDHSTKKVRSLLCYSCNQVLGMVKENKNTLNSMIDYLDKYSL